jgi:hypothetical protein
LESESLPDIGRNEQRNTRPQSITLLQQLIETDNNDSGEKELDNDENRIASTKIANISVHARQYICDRLSNGDQDTEELLGTITAEIPTGKAIQCTLTPS